MTASPGPEELMRRLVAGDAAGAAPDVEAVHAACERLYAQLSRLTGPDGSNLLFRRALSFTQKGHPAIAAVRIQRDGEPHLTGVDRAAESTGRDATVAGLEALLTLVLEQLERFIGHDIVVNIVHGTTSPVNPLDAPGPVSGDSA